MKRQIIDVEKNYISDSLRYYINETGLIVAYKDLDRSSSVWIQDPNRRYCIGFIKNLSNFFIPNSFRLELPCPFLSNDDYHMILISEPSGIKIDPKRITLVDFNPEKHKDLTDFLKRKP